MNKKCQIWMAAVLAAITLPASAQRTETKPVSYTHLPIIDPNPFFNHIPLFPEVDIEWIIPRLIALNYFIN